MIGSIYIVFFFFKQKTAYEIYQCDWSSDVCSSDLLAEVSAFRCGQGALQSHRASDDANEDQEGLFLGEIGRASCRERV